MASSLGRWLGQAQVRRPVLGASTRLRSEGNEGAIMPFRIRRGRSGARRCSDSNRPIRSFAILFVLACLATGLHAASDSRRGHRRLRRARSRAPPWRCSTTGKWSPPRSRPPTAASRSLPASAGRFFIVVSAQELSPAGDARLLRRPARLDRAQHGSGAGVGARIHRGDGHRHAHAAAADQRRNHRAGSNWIWPRAPTW